MISLWRIFWLEVVALVRSWTALMLLVASLGWMFAANFVLVTDATEEGKREMLVRYGLGGVFVLLIVAVLAAATGLIASERESKRLQHGASSLRLPRSLRRSSSCRVRRSSSPRSSLIAVAATCIARSLNRRRKRRSRCTMHTWPTQTLLPW